MDFDSKLKDVVIVRRWFEIVQWLNEFLLNNPDDNFFSLTREEQILKLEAFLSKSLAAAETLRAVPAK